jgi:hypothetical protein
MPLLFCAVDVYMCVSHPYKKKTTLTWHWFNAHAAENMWPLYFYICYSVLLRHSVYWFASSLHPTPTQLAFMAPDWPRTPSCTVNSDWTLDNWKWVLWCPDIPRETGYLIRYSDQTTGWSTEKWDFDFQQRQGNFLSSRLALWSTQPRIQLTHGSISLEGKEAEAWSWPLNNLRLVPRTRMMELYLHSQIHLHGVVIN